jgi:hypothetical protein
VLLNAVGAGGPGIPTNDDGAALSEAVQLNEEIKRVTRIAREVNLAAFNAMLTAKKAGGHVAGFAVVSSELRVFSGRMTAEMGELSKLIFRLVATVASMQKELRMRRHFSNAACASGKAAHFLSQYLARKDGELEAVRRNIALERDRLRRRLDRSLRLCDMGRALSRSARIEAVYGGEMTASLAQVSRHAEATVEEAVAILKRVETRLAA